MFPQALAGNRQHRLGQVDPGNALDDVAICNLVQDQSRAAANLKDTAEWSILKQVVHDFLVIVITGCHDKVVVSCHICVITHVRSLRRKWQEMTFCEIYWWNRSASTSDEYDDTTLAYYRERSRYDWPSNRRSRI